MEAGVKLGSLESHVSGCQVLKGLDELRESEAEGVWNMLLKEGGSRSRKERSGGLFTN